jgi:hypothetical protein
MRDLTPRLRLTFYAFAALALIAGLMLFAGATRTDDFFSWTIEPPLTAATLGAFYWAAFVLILGAAQSETWAAARPTALPVAVIATLLLVATLIHLDRFHRDLFGWFWVAAYALVPPLFGWVIFEQLRAPGEDRRGPRRLPGPLRVALVVEGFAMLGAGTLLFVAPDTAADLWPWALTPLTSRAIGAFVFGIGLAAAFAAWADDLFSFRGAADAYAVLGALTLLAVLLHRSDLGDDGVATAIYLSFCALILMTGAYGSSAARAASRS